MRKFASRSRAITSKRYSRIRLDPRLYLLIDRFISTFESFLTAPALRGWPVWEAGSPGKDGPAGESGRREGADKGTGLLRSHTAKSPVPLSGRWGTTKAAGRALGWILICGLGVRCDMA